MIFKKSILALILTAMCSGAMAQLDVIEEGFESWPPQGWSIYTLGAGNGWIDDWQGESHTGANSAYSSINNDDCDNWLVTPAIVIGADNYQVSFWELNQSVEFYDRASVLVSSDGADPSTATYDEVFLSIDLPQVWTEQIIDLSAYEGEEVNIAFRYEGTFHVWFIDDVKVSPSAYTDLGIQEVINPTGFAEQGDAEDVIIRIKNNGTTIVDEADIEWTVNGVDQTTFSSSTLALEPGDETDINLGSFDFSASNNYVLEFNMIANGDEVPANDVFTSNYEISNPKDLSVEQVRPEGIVPFPGENDVRIKITNTGANLIDTLTIDWAVNDASQAPFSTESLGLPAGQSTELVIGSFDFPQGVNTVFATANALGDINPVNDSYLAYAAVDTLWESFEGADFPPPGWSIEFGVRDNLNFGSSAQGFYYYSALPDSNFFGIATDTLYTPYLDVEDGDVFKFFIETAGFLATDNFFVAKDLDGNVTVVDQIVIDFGSWQELTYDISEFAGIYRFGIASYAEAPGQAKFDLFTSSASIYVPENDLAIAEGDIYFLARQNQDESFQCTVRNMGSTLVIGSQYTVNLVDSEGLVVSSQPGTILSPFQEEVFTLTANFENIGQNRLHFEIDFEADDRLDNNSSRARDVYVVPNTVELNTIGEFDLAALNFPFNANGSTFSLGEDDISQSMFYAEEFANSGDVYGMIYPYHNLLGTEEPKLLPLQVWVKQSELEDLSEGFIPTSEMTLVFSDTVEILPGMEELYIPFDMPIAYNGIENLVIQHYQFDPEWPPAVLRFEMELVPNGPIRTLSAFDVFGLDPNEEIDFYNEFTDHNVVTFVIDPTVEFSVVSGTVSDFDSQPIEGVEISITGSSLIAITDASGFYEFPELPYGEYELTAEILGYDEEVVNIDVNQPEITQDFTLEELIEVEVTGVVFGSNAPAIGIENVTISLGGYTSSESTSGGDGSFNLPNVFSNSDYEVTFSFYGYESQTVTFTTGNEPIDLGEIILTQLWISPYNVVVNEGFETNEVIWENPQESDVFLIRNDLETCSFSYTNEPNENVWLGNIFEIDELTTITDVEFRTDIYENATSLVTLDLFDADGEVIATSEPFLIFADSVHVIDMPNVVVDDDVFAAIHWQNNPLSTNALCIDFSEPDIANTAAIKYPGQDFVLLSEFFGEGAPNFSFLVRLNTLNDGDNPSNGEVLSYNVYRGLQSEFPDITNWVQLNDVPLTELSLEDGNWEGFDPSEVYRYAVETIYSEGLSEVTFSNTVNGIALSTSDLESSISLSVFPNPTQDFVRISFGSDMVGMGSLTVMDIEGRVINQNIQVPAGEIIELGLGDYASGIYFLNFNFEGFRMTKKLVVE